VSEPVATVGRVDRLSLLEPRDREEEGRAWVHALRGRGPEQQRAVARLHALLLRAARLELVRRRSMLNGASDSIDDLAMQSADNALVALMGKLERYRFQSRFTTWAYKFAILEAAVLSRRRAWQERELPADPQSWGALAPQLDPTDELDTRERLRRVTAAIATDLSPHQREVLTAVVLADVPIDVLAERLNTTRGALYKTLHDARRKLRAVVDFHDDV
jgi:RNA polymerase sigma-70 factor (ECF subfamily)